MWFYYGIWNEVGFGVNDRKVKNRRNCRIWCLNLGFTEFCWWFRGRGVCWVEGLNQYFVILSADCHGIFGKVSVLSDFEKWNKKLKSWSWDYVSGGVSEMIDFSYFLIKVPLSKIKIKIEIECYFWRSCSRFSILRFWPSWYTF